MESAKMFRVRFSREEIVDAIYEKIAATIGQTPEQLALKFGICSVNFLLNDPYEPTDVDGVEVEFGEEDVVNG